jgi:hypothetical protein
MTTEANHGNSFFHIDHLWESVWSLPYSNSQTSPDQSSLKEERCVLPQALFTQWQQNWFMLQHF